MAADLHRAPPQDDVPIPPTAAPILERRSLPDRRRRPTRVRLWGHRRAFRRAGEGSGLHVDVTPRWCVAVVIFLVAASGFDALFTLVHLDGGASEANPIMDIALGFGDGVFVGAKMALTALGAVFLALYHRSRLAFRSLVWATAGYALLTVYHVALMVLGA